MTVERETALDNATSSLPADCSPSGRAGIILTRLDAAYPDARSALNFRNPYELLVAAVLSAQCTDERVNEVTPGLFARYPTINDLAAGDPDELATQIRSLGLYRNKARNLIATAQLIVDRYGGEIPRDRDALMSLPGVGRKVANVILSNAFGLPALAVDRHVFRVSHRLGLAAAATPDGTEAELTTLWPADRWGKAHHLLVRHGREVCTARSPRCDVCTLADVCPARERSP